MFFVQILYDSQTIMPLGYSGLYDPSATTMKQTKDIHVFLTYKKGSIPNTKQLALPKRVLSPALSALEVPTTPFST